MKAQILRIPMALAGCLAIFNFHHCPALYRVRPDGPLGSGHDMKVISTKPYHKPRALTTPLGSITKEILVKCMRVVPSLVSLPSMIGDTEPITSPGSPQLPKGQNVIRGIAECSASVMLTWVIVDTNDIDFVAKEEIGHRGPRKCRGCRSKQIDKFEAERCL